MFCFRRDARHFACLFFLMLRATHADDSPSGGANATVSFIDGFKNPEDFLDIVGTPYVIVSEFAGSPTEARDTPGLLSVYDTDSMERLTLELMSDGNISSLADPLCENLSLEQLAPHGISGYESFTGNETWQFAVVNHFSYESIEFYEFDPEQPDVITARGCVMLVEDDFHNSISYSPDTTQMVVSVFFRSLFGFGAFVRSVSEFFGGRDGALKLISEGGIVATVKSNLNTANGVLWGGTNDNEVFVVESQSDQIVVLNSSNSFEQIRVIPGQVSPDNLKPDTPTSFLYATETPAFVESLLDFWCPLFGFLISSCGSRFEFEVRRYDWANQSVATIYTQLGSELTRPSSAIIKEDILYVGSFETEVILRVEL